MAPLTFFCLWFLFGSLPKSRPAAPRPVRQATGPGVWERADAWLRRQPWSQPAIVSHEQLLRRARNEKRASLLVSAAGFILVLTIIVREIIVLS